MNINKINGDNIYLLKKLKDELELTKTNNYEEQLERIFLKKEVLFGKLKNLNEKKEEISYFKDKIGKLPIPLVVTLSGTPRAGKTSSIENLYDFFKKTNFKTTYLKEPAGIIYDTLKTREEKMELLKDRIGFVERQYEIGKEYIENNIHNHDIILCDRGIIDTFIWYDMYYEQGMMNNKKYKEYLLNLKEEKLYYNQFVILFTSLNKAIKRDYYNSLSLDERTTTNPESILRYNESLLKMASLIDKQVDSFTLLNTSNMDIIDSSIIIASDMLDSIKKLYLRR